jgi:hypothetical protein
VTEGAGSWSETSDGSPTFRQRRTQTAIDSGAALVVTMLVWPFPLARAVLPVFANVLSVVVLWQVIQVGYFAVAMAVWGSTAGLRLQGLRLACSDGSTPDRAARLKWGVLAGSLALPQLAAPPAEGARSIPERAADVDVVTEQGTDAHQMNA